MESQNVQGKRSYEAPALEVFGSFEELTKAGMNGPRFDSNFQQNQPVPPNFRGS